MTAYTLLRMQALPAEITPEQDEVAWKVTERLCQDLLTGKLSQAKAIQLALAWKGTSNFLGWGGLSPTLDPPFRANLAYVLAHRFERLNNPQAAADLYGTTLRDAPADAPVRSLAEKELRRLGVTPK